MVSVYMYGFECDVIEWEDIKEIVPKEAAALEEQLLEGGMDIDEFCQAMENDEPVDEHVMNAWDRLDKSFTAATTVDGKGLELYPRYHDPYIDDDDEAIAFFEVTGVYQLTPAGAEYEHLIERTQFCGVG